MHNLEYFNLKGCRKVELLPDHITNQVFLRELHIRGTGIREVPSDIGELKKLEVLLIDRPLLDSLPNSLGNLSSLTRLWIDAPSLTSLPSSFDHLSRLAELYLVNNKLNSLPDIVAGSLPMLKEVFIANTAVSTITIIRDSCPNLETLRLASNDHLLGIQTLPTSVRKLEVHGCKMLKKIMGLRCLTNLRYLEIRNCPELRELASFADLHSLQRVFIRDCDQVVKIEGLENCRSLETLESRFVLDVSSYTEFGRHGEIEEIGNGSREQISSSTLHSEYKYRGIARRDVDMWEGSEWCGVGHGSSLSLSLSFPTLTVLSSLVKASRDCWTVKCGKIHVSQKVVLCCFLVNLLADTAIWLRVGRRFHRGMRLREGKWVIVSVLRGPWDWTESVYEVTAVITCGRAGVKRGVVVVAETGRVLEAFPHLLPVFI